MQNPTEDIDNQIDELRGKRLEAAPGDRLALANQITALEDERAKAVEGGRNTPEMQAAQKEFERIDGRMRDLGPQVYAAYREAQSGLPSEPVAETPASAVQPPVAEPSPQPVPTETAPQTPAAVEPGAERAVIRANPGGGFDVHSTDGVLYAATRDEAERLAEAHPPVPGDRTTDIASDVSRQLVSAGRSQEEADAIGTLQAVRYRVRSQNLRGTTPEELYDEQAPEIRGLESGGPRGAASGSLSADGRILTIFRSRADGSAAVHELGHSYLKELMLDAEDERATDSVRADAATVRQWLGAEAGADLGTRQQEKFARGFERYMMEGTAPTRELAGVLRQIQGLADADLSDRCKAALADHR